MREKEAATDTRARLMRPDFVGHEAIDLHSSFERLGPRTTMRLHLRYEEQIMRIRSELEKGTGLQGVLDAGSMYLAVNAALAFTKVMRPKADEYSSIVMSIRKGRFNCLTSTIYFNDLMDSLGAGNGLSAHTLEHVVPVVQDVYVETTANPGKTEAVYPLQHFAGSYPDYYIGTNRDLIASVYGAIGAEMGDRRDIRGALRFYEKAYANSTDTHFYAQQLCSLCVVAEEPAERALGYLRESLEYYESRGIALPAMLSRYKQIMLEDLGTPIPFLALQYRILQAHRALRRAYHLVSSAPERLLRRAKNELEERVILRVYERYI